MTRLPKTPVQTAAENRRAQLVRYLNRQSEERQVMFLRSLSDKRLRYDLQNELAEQRGQHHETIFSEREPERETKL